MSIQPYLLGRNINVSDALIVRLNIAQIANMSLIIPESAMGHVMWVIMEACGVASVGQVTECAAWQLVKVGTNSKGCGGGYERGRGDKLTGRASLVGHPYPNLGWSLLYA